MKRAVVLLKEGFEEGEALFTVDVLRRAQIACDTVSMTGDEMVTGSHGIKIKADRLWGEDVKSCDMIILPGGMPGAASLRDDPEVIAAVQEFDQNPDKYLAAICAAPIVFGRAGITAGKKVTSYPGFSKELPGADYIEDKPVVIDGHMITSRGPATVLPFAYAVTEALGGDSEPLREGMMYHFMSDYLISGNK